MQRLKQPSENSLDTSQFIIDSAVQDCGRFRGGDPGDVLRRGAQYELSPQEYLQRNLASSWLLPVLLYVPLALILVSRASYAI